MHSAMRARGRRPHGRRPRKSTALVVVDVLNAYDHPDADALVENMAGVVAQVSQLIGRARDEERPVIYVNDNYGHWNSSSAFVSS